MHFAALTQKITGITLAGLYSCKYKGCGFVFLNDQVPPLSFSGVPEWMRW
jgi:hypothetical protein